MAVDVGNTRAKFGVFRRESGSLPQPVHIGACVLRETPVLSAAFRKWFESLNVQPPAGVLVAGSQPQVRDQLLADWPLPECRPTLIDHYQQIPVGMDVDSPERVGIDRLLNTYAGWQITGQQRAVIAVDSGTATTVDLITSDGVFRGGSILPGLRLSAHALHDYTARLPLLNTDCELNDLPPLPGRNTEEAMRAGLFIGQLGAVRELCERLADAALSVFRQCSEPQVLISGGGGRQLAKYLPQTQYVDSLALNGLILLELRQDSRQPALDPT